MQQIAKLSSPPVASAFLVPSDTNRAVSITSFVVAQAALPALRESKGSIINIASMAAMRVLPQIGVYCMSKSAVVQMTKAMALEWGKHGINVNAICPGFFPSKMTAGTLKNLGEERLAAGAPLGRLGDDEDLKGLCVLYASDAGKHITGQWLAVDGGVSVVMGG